MATPTKPRAAATQKKLERHEKPARWNNVLAGAPDPKELRRRALILAAGRTFGQNGFHNTTLDDIARALAVTKPALYRYVKSKHEILYECHRIAIGMAEDALDAALAEAPRAVDALQAFVMRYIIDMTSELGTCVVLTEYYSMTVLHHRLIQQRRRALDTRLRELVRRCVDEGSIAPTDPKLAVFFFMGAINNINRWFTEDGKAGGAEIAERFTRYVLVGLRGRGGNGDAVDVPRSGAARPRACREPSGRG